MKAAWFERFGAADEVLIVGEQPDPVAGPGEVLVRLVASGVNPSDVKKRAGSFPNLLDDGLIIPHSDGAGIIEAVGDGVSDRQVGDRVWVYQAQFGRRFGTACEKVAIDATRAALLPANTDYSVGACLGIPAMTAHRTVFFRWRCCWPVDTCYRRRRTGWTLCHSVGSTRWRQSNCHCQQRRRCRCVSKCRR